ncbi:MAG: HAMP domain-containing sensor histidine kinase [Minisyncoccia bacterium]
MNKDEEIKKLQEENEKLLKLSSVKADMVSISAHQIRTSLSALKWIIKMFLNGDLGKLNVEQENLLKKAYEGNDRAISIVSELLLANKTENVTEKNYNFEELDVIELIDNSIFDFSGEASAKGIEILFLKPEEKLLQIRADKEKIRVVMQNLLENAIKYSNNHDKVFITLRKENDFIEISVKDNGIGISEEGKKKIFEKFYRDPQAQKKEVIGSGIGLFISKKIVEDHGGKIWFESSEKEGTSFLFTVPIYKKS